VCVCVTLPFETGAAGHCRDAGISRPVGDNENF